MMRVFVLFLALLISTLGVAEQPQTKVHGFKMIQVQPGSVYSRIGFVAGDILKTFNGKPLRSHKDVNLAMNVINFEKKKTSVKIGVLRGGKPLVLNYTFK